MLNLDNSENRRLIEHCYRTTKTLLNPIIDWTNNDVWQFLRYYNCEGNPLYKCGWKRIGCVGCPLGGEKSMKYEFKLYPKYKELYIRAFDKMLKARADKKLKARADKMLETDWKSGEEVFYWWINADSNQLTFDGFDILDV